MTEREVTVETTQVETESIKFCDSCGDPLEDIEYETLHRNPSAKTSINRPKFERLIERPVSTRYEMRNRTKRAHELRKMVERGTTVESEATIDVCHGCLETELQSADATAADTLQIPEERDTTGRAIPTLGLMMLASVIVIAAVSFEIGMTVVLTTILVLVLSK